MLSASLHSNAALSAWLKSRRLLEASATKMFWLFVQIWFQSGAVKGALAEPSVPLLSTYYVQRAGADVSSSWLCRDSSAARPEIRHVSCLTGETP